MLLTYNAIAQARGFPASPSAICSVHAADVAPPAWVCRRKGPGGRRRQRDEVAVGIAQLRQRRIVARNVVLAASNTICDAIGLLESIRSFRSGMPERRDQITACGRPAGARADPTGHSKDHDRILADDKLARIT
jgi:hypothetical protein